jgi:quercetin dioxygenase-like cupin family protein
VFPARVAAAAAHGGTVARMDEARILGPGEGDDAGRITIKARRPELAMTETLYEPGREGPAPHVHHHHVDSFYVLEGRLEYLIGPELEPLIGEPGDFVLIPPDVVHSFRNPGPDPARFLNFHAPGMGFADYIEGRKDDFDQHDAPADGGLPPDGVIVHPAGAGDRVALGATHGDIKAGGPDALGSLAVIDLMAAPGFPGPVRHRHAELTDSFYVLEGTVTVHLNGRDVELGPGSYALVPPGNVHTFSNPGDAPARALNVLAPGGFEQYLKEVAALPGPPDPAAMAEIASKYDFEPA